MKKAYEVVILNQKFVLKTDNDEFHVKRVADFVNKVFHEIQSKAQTISTQNVAILGALNIADEMFSRDDKVHSQIGEWKKSLQDVLLLT